MFRYFAPVCGLAMLLTAWAQVDDLWLANSADFRGRVRVSHQGDPPKVIYTRPQLAYPADPQAVMRIAQLAVGRDGTLFFCSGQDGAIWRVAADEPETRVLTNSGTVCDLAFDADTAALYFSTVQAVDSATKQREGRILRVDLASGGSEEVLRVGVTDVEGSWRGVFTVQDGVFFLATDDSPSRIYRVAGGEFQRVYRYNPRRVTGLSIAASGEFLVADDSSEIWSTRTFSVFSEVIATEFGISDVAAVPAKPRRQR
jgi:hypothetical protein